MLANGHSNCGDTELPTVLSKPLASLARGLFDFAQGKLRPLHDYLVISLTARYA